MISRRGFVRNQAVSMAGLAVAPWTLKGFEVGNRSTLDKLNFTMSLNPGAIGAKFNQSEILDLAIKFGYSAITCLPNDLSAMDSGEMDAFLAKMKTHKISWGSAGLPIDFRKDEATFKEGLAKMPATCAAMEKAGATRMNTWIMPSNAHYTYRTNFSLHQSRLKDAANIAGHHGVRLGLEYVGPKTLLTRSRFPFVRTLVETKELIAAIDENVGVVLDSFHWYCAEESKTDLLTLDNRDIIAVDLNDARSGFDVADQIDGKRELPMATGVIPLQDFMDALVIIGYDGPLRAEPFNQPLRDMDDEAAVKATYDAMAKAFALVTG
ncbi:MAG: sugar phosphate isomerase/epimerase [Saprospiraceae bacterium]|nr:sugar phosphate isomerase/epimerase [Saprospiraceae bacterium]